MSHPSSIVNDFDSAERFASVRDADDLLIRIDNDSTSHNDKIYFTYHTGNFAISMESKNNLDDGGRSNHMHYFNFTSTPRLYNGITASLIRKYI